jgi:hypothetical protein
MVAAEKSVASVFRRAAFRTLAAETLQATSLQKVYEFLQHFLRQVLPPCFPFKSQVVTATLDRQ